MAKAKAKAKSPSDVHPGVAMVAEWAADRPAKTGRTRDQSAAFVRDAGPPERKARIAWLKAAYDNDA